MRKIMGLLMGVATMISTLSMAQSPDPVEQARLDTLRKEAIGFYTGTGGKMDKDKAQALFEEAAATGDVLSKVWIAPPAQRITGRTNQFHSRYGALYSKDIVLPLLELVKQGDAEAQYLLGKAYHFRRGWGADGEMAKRLLFKSAEQGNDSAMYLLGIILQREEVNKRYKSSGCGKDKPKQDFSPSTKWITQAAELGNANAMGNLGRMYSRDTYGEKNYDKAARWIVEGANRNHANSMQQLGMLYRRGKGVPQDDMLAVKWYRRSAGLGNETAMTTLGSMYMGGRGVEKDVDEGLWWYIHAANKGFNGASYVLARVYEKENFPKEKRRIVKWYSDRNERNKRLSKMDLIPNQMGQINLSEISTITREEAIKLYGGLEGTVHHAYAREMFKTALTGDDEGYAALWLSVLNARGECGLKRNRYRAEDYLHRLSQAQMEDLAKQAKDGDAEAQYLIGMIYLEGLGVQQDTATARKWLEQSATSTNSFGLLIPSEVLNPTK